ncbi:UDP-N-acetylglucosamine--N-acetylmuramyl-(pentapeptide) pyrophosphoryl-undecaprenol N-acetylglucosamine transferase [Aquimarina algiphila]|uniref:UDP-N-acetylglucosamine--N-acetylmuramyl-(Pentapeptide) pyrophosphoryl-undecaprenol N-acetylglucosamine transferase n=1 Tax=Aquimarina algiphila TaxID=2047982 RepID=A0A554VGQ4_9FLAO|nr:UDP-N-acetylglucosamine--N-acetylmuramyl-(pentapeptide) pyrophosphoryl-undecaprenol N-acetylglucosamine transferase [Aquimarina algiphila]TSE06581.1 UDP-N-acetylglucosamine--N-acetylmuramyl-(pentapeptide) pyrophosphoryl-undecaprenol N-acetylglucosamine transferase [Aquimarina algiphila]
MKKKVLVAPLNWGLGHATRCIPIINALIEEGLEPVIASDGIALSLLKKEFPKLQTKLLPSYNIEYSKKGSNFKLKMLLNSPKIAHAISAEKKVIKKLMQEEDFCGIISDNRMGVRHKSIPSVFITHQLTVLSGKTTSISTKLHNKYIKKFDVCWVPDMADDPNLSGELGHPKKNTIPVTYLGPLSRFEYQVVPKKYDIMVLLSGPEPQRTLLEQKLFQEFEQSDKRIVFVRGLIEDIQQTYIKNNITIHNYLTGKDLEDTINSSNLIISRSGYTTVMDLAKLKKKAFFIPTPGQFEQEYLAERLTINKLVPSCTQNDFTLTKLRDLNAYRGLSSFSTDIDYGELFHFFQSK